MIFPPKTNYSFCFSSASLICSFHSTLTVSFSPSNLARKGSYAGKSRKPLTIAAVVYKIDSAPSQTSSWAKSSLASAAATSVLSHRWRGLWSRYATRLLLDYCHFPHWCSFSKISPRDFLTKTDHILNGSPLPKSTASNFVSSTPAKTMTGPYALRFFRHICSTTPKKIKLMIDFDDYEPLIPLPTCVLECESLVELELRGNINCKLPQNRFISLPNLKKLVVFLHGLDRGFITTTITLLNACPLLEYLNLSLIMADDEFVMDICGPNLKYFSAFMFNTSNRSRFVIDAPRLRGISIEGSLALYSFVNHPGRLQNAHIAFRNSTIKGKNDCLSLLLDLIRGISSVRSLRLSDNLAMFDSFHYMDVKARPMFANLTSLLLEKASRELVKWRGPIPLCLLRKLKFVQVSELTGDDNDMKLIKYILSNANVLDELHVWVHNLDDYVSGDGEKNQLWMEYMFCRDLFVLPKRSSSCEITFQGYYITEATSSEFEDGPSKVNFYGRQLSE